MNELPVYPLENDEPNEKNTVVFKLHVRCEKGGPRIKGAHSCGSVFQFITQVSCIVFFYAILLIVSTCGVQ